MPSRLCPTQPDYTMIKVVSAAEPRIFGKWRPPMPCTNRRAPRPDWPLRVQQDDLTASLDGIIVASSGGTLVAALGLPISTQSQLADLKGSLQPSDARLQAASPPPSLEPVESKSQEGLGCPLADYADQGATTISFRHSGWARDRRRIAAALASIPVSPDRLDAFHRCGCRAWVQRSADDPSHYRVRAAHCHDRFCVPCSTARSRLIAANLIPKIAKRRSRFLTLTLRHSNLPLAAQIDKLYQSFRRLRRTKLWLRTVDGGCSMLECKYNAEKDEWHPHLHCLVVGNYVPHSDLREQWHRITGDSYIVDIRMVRDDAHAVNEVCKYASKPMTRGYAANTERLCEAIVALKGRRLVLTFGEWRGTLLTDQDDATCWITVGPLTNIINDAAQGDETAKRILRIISSSSNWRKSDADCHSP